MKNDEGCHDVVETKEDPREVHADVVDDDEAVVLAQPRVPAAAPPLPTPTSSGELNPVSAALSAQNKDGIISSWPETADEIFEALSVIASLQPKEKFSTQQQNMISIDKNQSSLVAGLSRLWHGESRDTNIRSLERILENAFACVDRALSERERFPAHDTSREQAVVRLKNKQLVEKMADEIQQAKRGIATLRETYSTDMRIKAKIKLLLQTVENRLEQMNLSLKLLDEQERDARARLDVLEQRDRARRRRLQQQQQQQQEHDEDDLP